MRTKPESPDAEHGGHPTRWLAVLGVALAAGGIVVASVLPRLGEEEPRRDSVATSGLPPYVVEPKVLIDASAEPEPHPAAGPPTRLLVPSLGVDAPVVGAVVSDGTLWPPDDPQMLGWWTQGRPRARCAAGR